MVCCKYYNSLKKDLKSFVSYKVVKTVLDCVNGFCEFTNLNLNELHLHLHLHLHLLQVDSSKVARQLVFNLGSREGSASNNLNDWKL